MQTTHRLNRHAVQKRIVTNALLILFGFVMVYPLIWLVFGSFKTNNELFGTINLIPNEWVLTSYRDGWFVRGQYTYGHFFLNTFKLVIPTLIFTLISCSFVGCGFARFRFPGHRTLFSLMIATMMLPNAVMIVPRFILFNKLGWSNSYAPFIVPAMFGTEAFFVFMFVQFYRGLPMSLDEAATIDGCGALRTYLYILLPLAKPAIISAMIFKFIWAWNDFFNALIYINSTSKFPIALALRMSIDTTSSMITWNQVLAMAVLSIVPPTVLFFLLQKYFVEGIATTGMKM